MSTQITAVYVSATVTATDYATRIRGISWGTAATKGDLVVRNGIDKASDRIKTTGS